MAYKQVRGQLLKKICAVLIKSSITNAFLVKAQHIWPTHTQERGVRPTHVTSQTPPNEGAPSPDVEEGGQVRRARGDDPYTANQCTPKRG